MKNDTWKLFEQLTRRIQQDIAPGACVTHNENMIGKSGAEYQCDVVLRATVGQLEFTCLIECKDHDEPIGSEIMRGFIGKLVDLRHVHQGIIVSKAGFTTDALKLAREHGINVYKLVDVEHIRWRHEALLPIVFISIALKGAAAKFFDLSGNPRFYTVADGTPVPEDKAYLFDHAKQSYRLLRDVLEELWDLTLDERIPRRDDVVRTKPGQFRFYLGDNRHEDITLEISFQAQFTYHYNRVSLAACQGFIDQQASVLIPAAYETTPLDVEIIVKNWPAAQNEQDVPFVPVDFFYICCFLHRESTTPRKFTLGRTTGPVAPGAITI